MERETLRLKAKKLRQALAPLEERFDALPLHRMMSRFSTSAQEAEPADMQRLLRATVHKMVWQPEGKEQVVEFYSVPASKCADTTGQAHLDGWLERNERSGCPGRIRTSDRAVNSRLLYH